MLSIHQLHLHHFRNYTQMHLPTNGACVVLTGANGAGKTNILEAVSLLSPGRGLRKAKLREMSQQPAQAPWVVAAEIQGFAGAAHVGTSLDPEALSERRLVKLDGEKLRSQTQLAEHLAISWQTPQMDGLFLASDGERRRYLDRLIYSFDAAHLTRVNGYEHAMRERNKLLASAQADDAWLNALEENMAQNAVAIAYARLEANARLNASIEQAEDSFPKAHLAMQGEVETLAESTSASDAEQQLQQQLAARRRQDAAAGRATYGTHKSLWHVTHVAKQMAASYCSTGEQKALLLTILLAHARARKAWLGAAPILLLDETVAHLDAARRAALAEAVRELHTQAWLTGTDAADFTAFEGFSRHFEVENGAVLER